MTLVIDIETGPLDTGYLLSLDPFDESKFPHPGEFDPASVKTGNIKDAAKIAEKIAAAREAHAAEVAGHGERVKNARIDHAVELRSRAALSALTGQVLAIGYHAPTSEGQPVKIDGAGMDERTLIDRFWNKYTECRDKQRSIIGFNLAGFDVPFLVRRSWLLGLEPPEVVFDLNRRYLDRTFIDLMQVWGCGIYGDRVKLDTLAKALKVGGKPVDGNGQAVTGAMFAELWKSDRAAAEAYLANDLRMTAAVARKLGVI